MGLSMYKWVKLWSTRSWVLSQHHATTQLRSGLLGYTLRNVIGLNLPVSELSAQNTRSTTALRLPKIGGLPAYLDSSLRQPSFIYFSQRFHSVCSLKTALLSFIHFFQTQTRNEKTRSFGSRRHHCGVLGTLLTKNHRLPYMSRSQETYLPSRAWLAIAKTKTRPCLVHPKNQKLFKIFRQIKSCGICMGH